MLKYGHDSGKWATRGSKTANVAQFAKRVQRTCEQRRDADDQQPVRAALADRPPAQISEERDREHHRHGAGDQRPVRDTQERGIGRLAGIGVGGPDVAVQTGLHVGQTDNRERTENRGGGGPPENGRPAGRGGGIHLGCMAWQPHNRT